MAQSLKNGSVLYQYIVTLVNSTYNETFFMELCQKALAEAIEKNNKQYVNILRDNNSTIITFIQSLRLKKISFTADCKYQNFIGNYP